MQAYYCDTFVLPLPDGHSFPMQKYALLRAAVLRSGAPIELKLPPAATDAELLRVHCPAYVERVRTGTLSPAETRKIGFPYSAQMAERTRRVSGATVAALCDALSGDGFAVNLAGGTHHAFYDHGAGYCVFNDSVVAARAAQSRGLATRVLIIDLDVHQGNGTASICANDASITTFSMHAARNFPLIKEKSDIDVALPDGCDDATYLQALATHLPQAFAQAKPDAVIYLAGADPFEADRLGFLKLTKAGLAARDRMVLQGCFARGVPAAITMAGGYAPKLADIVDIHLQTVLLAADFARQWRHHSVRTPLFACTAVAD
jgi:acetoin utilization deacetylase AcuC-like enzyme